MDLSLRKHDAPLTPQEREAMFIRHDKHTIVTQLEDGAYAVFSNDYTRESMVIVTNPDDLALAISSRLNMCRRVTRSPFAIAMLKQNGNGNGATPKASKKEVAVDFGGMFEEEP